MNVVLVRVLYAHALVAAPRLAMGWLRPGGPRLAGDPRVGMTGIFLSLSRILPDRDPLGDDVDFYVAVEHGLSAACWTSVSSSRGSTHLLPLVGARAAAHRRCVTARSTAPPPAMPGTPTTTADVWRFEAVASCPGRAVGASGPEPYLAAFAASANRPSAVCSTRPSTSSESSARSRWAVSVSHATSSSARVTGESLPRNTSSSRPRTWRSVPAYRWARRAVPVPAGIPARPPRAVAQRAQPAPRRARGAHRRAEFHQRGRERGARRVIGQQGGDVVEVARRR